MPEFLVELYVSQADAGTAKRSADDAELAAQELTRDGTPVRYVHSIFVPEDETCVLLFEAASAAAVRAVERRAGLTFDRVAEAVAAPRKGGPSR